MSRDLDRIRKCTSKLCRLFFQVASIMTLLS
jgi:hypothetical protein